MQSSEGRTLVCKVKTAEKCRARPVLLEEHIMQFYYVNRMRCLLFLAVIIVATWGCCVCRIKSGEKEEIKIPRAPPRISAERLSDHIVKSLKL